MTYRPEIDGLRAIAVLPVILFHANFSTFSGGFVGVDVFFVISGYLIASIILKDLEAGTFSFCEFYERRARRILPALIFVIICCIPFAWMWMMPTDLKGFATSVVAVSVFASNILFWQQSGYFDTAAELTPLLHTWSLAVEEQFYIFFPMAMLIFWRFGRKNVLSAIALAAVASLALSEYCSRNHPLFNFYWLPTRAWELAAGSLCAFVVIKPQALRDEFLAIAGLAAVLLAVFCYNKTTPFPSLYALVPVLGSCAIILFARQGTIVGSLLSLKPCIGIGLISYSAYLWHQPLFAFARIRQSTEPSYLLMTNLILASIVLAYFSWRYIEVPARKRGMWPMPNRVTAVSLCGGLLLLLVSWGVLGHVTNGFPSRVADAVRSHEYFDATGFYREGSCFLRPEQTQLDFDPGCAANRSSGVSLIWGDSHAAALSYGLRGIASNVSQLTASGCPPLKDSVIAWRKNCHGVNEFVLKALAIYSPSRIILHANWILYTDSLHLLSKTLAYLREQHPATEIIVVGGVPHWKPSLPAYAWRYNLDVNAFGRARNVELDAIRKVDLVLKAIARERGAEFYSVVDLLCEGDECEFTAPTSGGWQLMSWDEGHLTDGGSIYIAQKLFGKAATK